MHRSRSARDSSRRTGSSAAAAPTPATGSESSISLTGYYFSTLVSAAEEVIGWWAVPALEDANLEFELAMDVRGGGVGEFETAVEDPAVRLYSLTTGINQLFIGGSPPPGSTQLLELLCPQTGNANVRFGWTGAVANPAPGAPFALFLTGVPGVTDAKGGVISLTAETATVVVWGA